MTIILKYLIKEASLLQKIVSNNQKQLSKIMKGLVGLEREKSQRRSRKAASPKVMESWTLSTSQKAQLANL
jgi:hypothetical protein